LKSDPVATVSPEQKARAKRSDQDGAIAYVDVAVVPTTLEPTAAFTLSTESPMMI
jgi:hypothetical protein